MKREMDPLGETDLRFSCGEVLKASEEKYLALLEFSPEAFFQGDSQGNIVTTNKKAAELTRYSTSELLCKKMADIFPPSLSDDLTIEGKNLKLDHSNPSEGIILRKDGEIIQVEMNSKSLPDGTFQCFVRDVTQRRRAEDELLKVSEEKFRQLIENSFDIIVLLDADGIQRFVSESCEKILGYRPDELTNIPVIDQMIHPDDHEEIKKALQMAAHLSSGGVQYRHRHKNGGWVYLEAFGSNQLNNPSIRSFVLNVRDITARRQTEEALRESEARLYELNATKDKFFSIIGHDLRSPFNSIMGFSNLLEEQIQQKDYQGIEHFAAIIQKSSNRALALLQNLLEWSRSQTGSMVFKAEPIEMMALMEEVTDLLTDSAKQKDISISLSIPPMASILADREMIGTTLRNLLSNAVKFTNPGGEIVISAQQKQDQWTISVSDNGVGIQKEALEKLFRIDQSHTTTGTQNERGTGLGLILCKEFVEKHGGKIWVESQVERGSTFCFTIPKPI